MNNHEQLYHPEPGQSQPFELKTKDDDLFATDVESNNDIAHIRALPNGYILASHKSKSDLFLVTPTGNFEPIENYLNEIPSQLTDADILKAVKKIMSSFRYMLTVKESLPGVYNSNGVLLDLFIQEEYNFSRSDSYDLAVKILKKFHNAVYYIHYKEIDDKIQYNQASRVIDNPSQILSVTNESMFINFNGSKLKISFLNSNNPSDWQVEGMEEQDIFENTTDEIAKLENDYSVRLNESGQYSLYNKPDGSNHNSVLNLGVEKPIIDEEGTIFFFSSGSLSKITKENYLSKSYYPETIKIEGINNIKQVISDPLKIFLIIRDDHDQLSFVDIDSLKVIKTIDNISGEISINDTGEIYYINSNSQINKITTNLNSFVEIKKEKKKRQRVKNLIRKAQEFNLDGDVKQIKTKKSTEIIPDQISTEKDVEQLLQVKLIEKYKDRIKNASEIVELHTIMVELNGLKQHEKYKPYIEAFTVVEKIINEQVNKLNIQLLNTQSNELESILKESSLNLKQSIKVGEKVKKLNELRLSVNLQVLDSEEQAIILQKINIIKNKFKEVSESLQSTLKEEIERNISLLKQTISVATTIGELSTLENSPTFIEFQSNLKMVSDLDVRQELNNKWMNARAEVVNHINEKQNIRKETEERTTNLILRQITDLRIQLKSDIETIWEESNREVNLRAWINESMAHSQITSLIGELDLDTQNSSTKEHNAYINELISELEKQKTKPRSMSREENVSFGGELFPVFFQSKATFRAYWQLPQHLKDNTDFMSASKEEKAKRIKQHKGFLIFESDSGKTWKSEKFIKMDFQGQEDLYEELKSQANRFFNPERKVPEFSSELRLTDHTIEVLGEMAKNLRAQMGLRKDLTQSMKARGLLIMQGDAGVGKDFNVDLLGAYSNMEVVNIPCRKTMDPEDLTTEFRFNPEKGTYRVPSAFAQALSRPGVIVNLIEINALPPEITKMLNSVFDFRRTLYFTQSDDPNYVDISLNNIGKEIAVNPKTIFIGTMNPPNYIGTQPLAQEFKSRARIMDVDYPPFTVVENDEGDYERLKVTQTTIPTNLERKGFSKLRVRPDEAYIMAQNIDCLEMLTKEEFDALWNYYVNNEDNPLAILETSDREKTIKALKLLIAVSNKIRDAYRAYQSETSDDIVNFVYTMRENTDIIFDLEKYDEQSVKKAIAKVILPKISEHQEKEQIKAIIDTA